MVGLWECPLATREELLLLLSFPPSAQGTVWIGVGIEIYGIFDFFNVEKLNSYCIVYVFIGISEGIVLNLIG